MKRVNIFFDDKEWSLVEALQNKYGGKANEIIKSSVKFNFDKSFPAYKMKGLQLKQARAMITPPEEDLTPEQICEMLGGKVTKKDGTSICYEPNERRGLVVPLTLMGKKGIMGDYTVKN